MVVAVEALYSYESKTARGHSVVVRPGERFLLVSTASDEWWYVTKDVGPGGQFNDDGFYMPSSYVKRLNVATTQLSSFKAGGSIDDSARKSLLFSAEGYRTLSTLTGGTTDDTQPSLRHHKHDAAATNPRTAAVRLADPRRISKSIPVDLNFVHNIPELALLVRGAQDARASDVDASPLRATAAPQLPAQAVHLTDAAHSDRELSGVDDDMHVSNTSATSGDALRGPVNYQNSSLPRSVVNDSGVLETSFTGDEEVDEVYEEEEEELPNRSGVGAEPVVYENTSYLEASASCQFPSARPPSAPQAGQTPLRTLPDGWAEYVCDATARPFFYHAQTRLSRWKPPRHMIGPNEVAAMMNGSGDSSSCSVADSQKSQGSDDVTVSELSDSAPTTHMPDRKSVAAPLQTSGSVRTSEVISAHANGAMSESVDSGLGGGSSSLKNRTFGISLRTNASVDSGGGGKERERSATTPASRHDHDTATSSGVLAQRRSSCDSYNNNGEVSAAVVDGGRPSCSSAHTAAAAEQQTKEGGRTKIVGEPPPGQTAAAHPSRLRASSSTTQALNQNTIKNGTLDKCKATEAGKKLTKKTWSSSYIYLTGAHLIFYKDEKSAEKRGNHYETPLGVCDLRGAKLAWVDGDKKRKHVFELQLIDENVYLFSSQNMQDVNEWFHSIRHVISKLPLSDAASAPVAVIESGEHKRIPALLQLNRSSSTRLANHPPLPVVTATPAASSSPTDKARRTKRKSDSLPLPPDGEQSRASILERLKRFFRSRPSIESLKEKGIYKPEPVFGSSLMEICTKEKNLVPKFITVCQEIIELKGLDTDGLYRISGNLSQVQKIRCQVDQDKYALLIGEDDIHVLTGALKLFFRELQDPVFPLSKTKDFLATIRIPKERQRQKTFKALLAELPPPHYHTLRHLLLHLIRVSNESSKNRMQAHNLAIVFGPTLFSVSGGEKPPSSGGGKKKTSKGPPPPPSAASLSSVEVVQSNSHLAFNMIMQGQVVEYLLKHHKKLFDVADNNNAVVGAAFDADS